MSRRSADENIIFVIDLIKRRKNIVNQEVSIRNLTWGSIAAAAYLAYGAAGALCFDEKFKKYISVIVPLWFILLFAGLPVVIYSFSWTLLVLLVILALEAFVILPLISTKHGCKECPQKNIRPPR